ANVIVVSDTHPVPQGAELGGNFVSELLRTFPCSFGSALDLLSMLVGSSQKKRIKTHHALAAGNGVAGERSVSVSDMRPGVDIINRGRDVELFLHDCLCWAEVGCSRASGPALRVSN